MCNVKPIQTCMPWCATPCAPCTADQTIQTWPCCCRLLVSKAAQALYLLRTLTAGNVNRMVLRLPDPTRKALAELVSKSLAASFVLASICYHSCRVAAVRWLSACRQSSVLAEIPYMRSLLPSRQHMLALLTCYIILAGCAGLP